LFVGKFPRKGRNKMKGEALNGKWHIPPTYNDRQAHALLGHNSENDTRTNASYLGWNITRGLLGLGVCESCANNAKGKTEKIIVPQVSQGEKVTVINGRWFHDNATNIAPKGVLGK
jgi:hypothetical protein